MPRVSLSTEQKKAYKVKDLAGWIYGKMHSMGLKQEDLAKELHITQSAFSSRLNPKTYEKDPFKYGELLILFKILDATDEEILRLMRL